MKILGRYLEKYRLPCILAPLFKLTEALFDLFVPLIVADIINNGITARDEAYIITRIVLMLVLALLGLLFSVIAQYFAAMASVGFTCDVRQDLFDHIESLSFAKLDGIGSATFITRLTSDLNQIQNGLNIALRLLLRSPFIVFGAMIMAFTIDIRCALIFVAVIALLSVSVMGIMLMSIPMFRKVQQALDELLTSVRDNLTGVRIIRAFCHESEEIRGFNARNDHLTKSNEKVGRLNALLNPLTFALINIATVVLIWVGALRVDLGRLAQGDVVALYNYMAQIVVELIKLANMMITIDKSLACAQRVSSVFAIDQGMTYPTSPVEKAEGDEAVSFDHVSFGYEGAGADSLIDISFSLKKGQTLGIIGATGSGKTTLVNLIPRFYDVKKGKVKVNGVDVRCYPPEQLIDMIGVVPQKPVLFEGTIRDNMKLGKEDASDAEINKALAVAQAGEIVDAKAQGLDYPVEQSGRNLSGGQKQRFTIARALLKKPAILIMDDASSALDFATDARLRQAINKLSMTTITVSQRTGSLRCADMILVLDEGRLIGRGTHEELMQTCDIYREIHFSQFPDERPNGFEGAKVSA